MDTPPAGALDRIREEIDDIDDAMLALLAKRFAAVERKCARSRPASGAIVQSPIRPAREAAILRRLVDAKPDTVPAELRIRLWRAIISASTADASPVADPCRHGAF